MKNTAIVILSLLSIIFFFGWVLPKVPYTRRLTGEKAEDLYLEYIEIVSKPNQSLPDITRRDEIAEKLAYAGYVIVKSNEGRFPLIYPDYAK